MSDRGVSDRIRSNVWAIVLCFAVLTGSAVAASGGGDAPEAQPSATAKKQIKKLKRKLAGFEARLAALEGKPAGGPPTGPAGGDLTGSYPSPGIGPGTVGATEIVPESVGSPELANAVTFSNLEVGVSFATQFATFFNEAQFFGGYIDMSEISEPGNPANGNEVRIYARESANNTQLIARFANGDLDLLAEEAAP
jgi:hypothetical protein